jgi:Ca2+-binding RTX toxin-like protein
MPMGTQGNDVLNNDPGAAAETIEALGGDDTINITNLNVQGVSEVAVDGGDGFDTLNLTAEPYIYALSATSAVLMDGVLPPDTSGVELSYSQVERLVVHGIAWVPNGGWVTWTTGDTIDEIHLLGTFQGGHVTVDSGGGDDSIYFEGDIGYFSTAMAGAGDDLVDMSGTMALDASALGGEGNDRIIGGGRSNYLDGGDGDDTVEGRDGGDALVGGGGQDILIGGEGADRFKYYSVQDSPNGGGDSIIDFEPGVDKIDLSWIRGLQWIGPAPFNGWGGQVRGTAQGIEADINGDMLPDLVIFLQRPNGGLDLTAGDFVL